MLNINFKYKKSVDISIVTDKRVIFIIDESATGKTLLFNIIDKYFKSTGTKKVFRIDYYNHTNELKRFNELIENENNIIIFDNANEFIHLFEDRFKFAKANILVVVRSLAYIIHGDFVTVGKVLNTTESIKFVEDKRYQ